MAVMAHEPHHPTQTHAEVTRDVVSTLGTAEPRLLHRAARRVGDVPGRPQHLHDAAQGRAGPGGYTSRRSCGAVYITTFVFWIGIGHAGTLISAILFLFRSPWRTAVYRSTEAMTVFAVMTAALFPIIHIGRQWFFYWLLPYPNQR